jgi:hypothetical protein
MQPGPSRARQVRSGILVADSVTTPGSEVAGNVLIAGSHCGVYSGYLAACLDVRAIILNDAGIGLNQAGVAGLAYLQRVGIPAAAVSHESARIGDGADTAAHGVVAWVNEAARAAGCAPGQAAIEAALRLRSSPSAHGKAPPLREARQAIDLPDARDAVVVLDSASLVSQADEMRIVITASHGGLLGGDPRTALKVEARAAFFNDAGVGREQAGISRLPELARRGIIAGTVSHWTACIGDAMSSWDTGVLSHVNRPAEQAGAKPGMPLREFVRSIAAG